jgi:archaellum component FlaF (FlaF/FlaG flagellin family)
MKNIYKHLLILLLFTSSGIQFVMGQSTNLAPSATATAYTRDPNGLYQWSKINDLSYASCGSQEAFVWTSTYGIDGTEYMQWEWTSAKTVGKITFHNAWNNTRNLTACVLQYWNGSTWSNWATLNIAQACVDSAKFTPVTTTKIRLTDFKMTASGQLSNPSWREIEVWSASTKKDDVGITSITMPLCSPTLVVGYTNLGTNVIDSAKINWSVNGTLQTQNRYNTSQKPGGGSTFTLAPDYNFVDGSTYSLKVWTSLPNNKADSVPTNDTSKLTFKYIGPAGTPSVKDVVKCGPGRAPLKATTVNAGDSVVWYDAASKGNLVARGKNTLSPPLFLGTNTFYAQGFKMGSPSKLANGMSGTTYLSGNYGSYNGGMIDMSPKSDIVIDSFAINFFTSTANSTYEIWYKTGTYSGNERAASAWTNVISGGVARIVNVSGRNRGYLKIPELSLKGGVTYAFYITTTPTTGNDLYATYGTSTYSNADVSITGGAYIYGQFASNGVYAPYNIDLETYYRKVSCPSARVPLVVTVNPSPNGASFDKSTPFQTTQPNTLGTSSNPDIVANGDQLTYTLTPPKGYINSGYGSKWIALNLSVKSKKGVDIDPSYYSWSTPSGSSAGVLTFKPDSKLTDTMVIVSLQLKDLGPYFCDSTILRHIYVAPRPNPDFKFNQPVCDGDAVVFDNTSSISSGGLIYRWDFGTGNPADTSDAYTTVFTFPTYGTYDVKLKATSIPYGYIEIKTIKVVVTEIPRIDFKVLNACEKVPVSFQ